MASKMLGKRARASLDSEVHARPSKRIHVLEDEHGDVSDDEPQVVEVAQTKSCSAAIETRLPIAQLLPARGAQHHAQREVSDSTPTKDFRFSNRESPVRTPTTPRHYDALSKNVASTLRCRVSAGGTALNPRTPRTPKTPNGTPHSIYSEARKLFTRGAHTDQLVGRERERRELRDFVSTRLDARTGGCMYVSGPPGTGKSAFVTRVCQELDEAREIAHTYINCMSLKHAADIYDLVCAGLGLFGGGEEALKTAVLNSEEQTVSTSCVLVLDEVDSLVGLDVAVLYKLFAWALAPDSRFILVGIANALDLTDRFLPRLKAQNLKPTLLPFLPYSAAEIEMVLLSRCRSLLPSISNDQPDFVPILHPTAIKLISKKIASQTGDLRKAFDVAKRTIDLIEGETKEKLFQKAVEVELSSPTKHPLANNPNLSSPKKAGETTIGGEHTLKAQKRPPAGAAGTTLQTYGALDAPRATLAHVTRVTSAFFNGSATSSRLKALNLQQKAVLFSLVALEARNRARLLAVTPPPTPTKSAGRRASALFGGSACAAPTVRALGEAYGALCRRGGALHALAPPEFREVVTGLEVAGLVTDGATSTFTGTRTSGGAAGGFGRGRGGRGGASATVTTPDDRRVAACVDAAECAAAAAAEGVGGEILAAILRVDGW